MPEENEQRQAVEALAMVSAHQERAERAARAPWWVYVAIFVLPAAGSAVSDFGSLSGAKLIALLVLVAFVVVLVVSFTTRSSLLSRMRGVERQQSFDPLLFGGAVVIAGAVIWFVSHYGSGFGSDIARAVGLGDYPNTVTGVFYGLAFSALFALGQVLTSQRRKSG